MWKSYRLQPVDELCNVRQKSLSMVYNSVHIDDEGFLLSDLLDLFVKVADIFLEMESDKNLSWWEENDEDSCLDLVYSVWKLVLTCGIHVLWSNEIKKWIEKTKERKKKESGTFFLIGGWHNGYVQNSVAWPME